MSKTVELPHFARLLPTSIFSYIQQFKPLCPLLGVRLELFIRRKNINKKMGDETNMTVATTELFKAFDYRDIPANMQSCPHWVLWVR